MEIETVESSTIVHTISKRNDKFLLVKEKNNTCHMPVGRIKKGESLIEGVIREVKEESGVDCLPIRIFKIIHKYLPSNLENGETKLINRVHYFFEVKIPSNISQVPNEHTNGARWYNIEQISDLPLRTILLLDHLQSFNECKENKTILPIKFIVTA